MMPVKKKPEFGSEVRNYLKFNFHLPVDRTTDSCLNGHVIHLYVKSPHGLTSTVEKVNKLFEVKATFDHVKNVVMKSKPLARKYSRPDDQQNFEALCNEGFMTSNNFSVSVIPLSGYREFLASNFSLPDEENKSAINCMNGHALNLYFNVNPWVYETSRKINKFFCLNSTANHISKILLPAKILLRSFHKESGKFENLCNEPFDCSPKSTRPKTKKNPLSSRLSESTQGEDLARLSTSVNHKSEAYIESSVPTVSVGTNTGEDSVRRSRGNFNSIEIELKNKLSNLSQRIATASKENRRKLADLRSKLKDMPFRLKVLNHEVKRKTTTIKALRKQIHELQKIESRKKIRYLKVKKYSLAWKCKVKYSDQMNSNKVAIANTETAKPVDEKNIKLEDFNFKIEYC